MCVQASHLEATSQTLLQETLNDREAPLYYADPELLGAKRKLVPETVEDFSLSQSFSGPSHGDGASAVLLSRRGLGGDALRTSKISD